MTRKIIQIAVTPGYKVQSHVGEFKSPGGVVALCDDGTLWRLPDGNEKYADAWFRLADIPQPKPYDPVAHMKEIQAMPDEPEPTREHFFDSASEAAKVMATKEIQDLIDAPEDFQG